MDDTGRLAWSRRLVTAGWLFVIAYLGVVVSQVRRAASITEGSFDDGVWGQRVETLSFVAIPQNLIVLAPAAAAVVAGALVAGSSIDARQIWLSQLTRVVAGVCYVVVFIAAVGIVGVFFRDTGGNADLDAVLSRAGGIAMSVAMLGLCLQTESRR